MRVEKILMLLCLLLFFPFGWVNGQTITLNNLYLEIGASNNTLSVTSTNLICPCTHYYSDLKIQPRGGIGYSHSLGGHVKIESFIGYDNLGTSSTEGKYKTNYIIKVVKGSIRGIYKFKGLEFGPFIAYNRHVQVKEEVYEQTSGEWDKLVEYDHFHSDSILLKDYSFSGGLMVRFKVIYDFSVTLNAGMSLTNLFNSTHPNVIVETPPSSINYYNMGIDVIYQF